MVPSSLHDARANSQSIMASIIRSENLDMINVCRINVGFVFKCKIMINVAKNKLVGVNKC